MSTWEERMAARAAARRGREAAERERVDRAAFQRRAVAEIDWLTAMPQCPFDPDPPWSWDPWVLAQTLGEAVALLDETVPWACACCGPPNCCVNRYKTAELLRRDAHIVARLLADLRDREHG